MHNITQKELQWVSLIKYTKQIILLTNWKQKFRFDKLYAQLCIKCSNVECIHIYNKLINIKYNQMWCEKLECII